MKILLDSEVKPEVEVLAINLANQTVDFKDFDGICNAPYVAEGDLPTEYELKAAIEKALGIG